MSVSDIPDEVEFRASSHSGGGGCVEIGWACGEQRVVVRHSRNRDLPALTFTLREWEAFIRGAKEGEFDLPDREPV